MTQERRKPGTELIALQQEVDSLKHLVEGLRAELYELKNGVRELVDAWKAAGSFIKVVKVLAAVGGGIAAVWAAARGIKV